MQNLVQFNSLTNVWKSSKINYRKIASRFANSTLCHFLTIAKKHLLLEHINSLNSSLLMLLMLSVKSVFFNKKKLMSNCQKIILDETLQKNVTIITVFG
jgi:hypothetical protein